MPAHGRYCDMPRPAWLEPILQPLNGWRRYCAAWLGKSGVVKVGSPDLHQAKMRFLVLAGCIAYGVSIGVFEEGLTGARARVFATGVVLFGLFSFHTYAYFKRSPTPNFPRRTVGLFADHAAACACLAVTGPYAAALAWLPLFIIQGVGIRFGVRWLFASQAIGVASVGVFCLVNPYFQGNAAVGFGAVLSVLVLPLYFVLLAVREARIKAALESARLSAEEANAAKGRFVAMISHELRTPLTGISGLNELMRQQDLPPQSHQMLIEQSAATSLMLTMVNDVLDLSKIEAGGMQVQEVDFDPQQLALTVLQALSFQARSKGLSVHVELDAGLPILVCGSPFHVSRILQNILGNAIKFTLEGSITLRVRNGGDTRPDEGTPNVQFEVLDTGIGIPAAALPKIYDRFYQVDAAITRRFGGTGLGTSLVKEFVELLQGDVRLESQLGEGTRCLVTLPFKRASATKEAAPTNLAGTSVAVWSDGIAQWPSVKARLLAAGARIGRSDEARQGLASAAHDADQAAILLLSDSPSQGTMAAISAMELTDPAFVLVGDAVAPVRWCSEASSHLVVRARSDAVIPRAVELAMLGAQPGLQRQSFAKGRLGPIPAPTALRVLVAEDTPTVQLVMRVTLESAGFIVSVADDGTEALREAGSKPFDVVVLDWNMPGLDGIEVVRAIRGGAGPNALTPIVIATAAPSQQLIEEAKSAGAQSVLGKPFQGSSLVRALEAAVSASLRPLVEPATGPALCRELTPLLDFVALEGPDSVFRAVDPEKLLGAFTRDVEKNKTLLLEAVAKVDVDLFRSSVHSMTGYAGTFGARQLQSLLANAPRDADEIVARGSTAVAELCETMEVTARVLGEWSKAFVCAAH